MAFSFFYAITYYWKRKARDTDGRSTTELMPRQALEITDRYHVAGLLDIDLEEEENRFKFSACKNFPAIEEAFRITKSYKWVKMDPVFHWTDSNIRVHALTCMIALLLVRISYKRACAKVLHTVWNGYWN